MVFSYGSEETADPLQIRGGIVLLWLSYGSLYYGFYYHAQHLGSLPAGQGRAKAAEVGGRFASGACLHLGRVVSSKAANVES